MPMLKTLSLDLTKPVTKAENALASKLQVAALTKDADEIARLLKHRTIKKLFRRGVLKIYNTIGDLSC